MTNNINKTEIIRERLEKYFQPSYLDVIDDSDQHIGHAGHQGGGRHFTVKIAASQFNDLAIVSCHRLVYSLFSDMIPDEIHALSIKIIR